MKLATLRVGGSTRAVRLDGDRLVDLGATDLGELLSQRPGDIIATGTPGGVGHARDPKRYLTGGERVVAEIQGIGRLENTVAEEGAA